jgi:hypothetical protein
MARREWRPSRDVERAAESVGVLAKAIAKHVVGADTSRESRRLDELAEEARREDGS